MKEDEETLINLYNSSDICSTLWTKEFKDMGIKFQNYEYKGSDNEIILLLEEYKNYGKLIEEIHVLINIKNYDKGIEQLEKLKEVAQKNEKELNRLYEKNYNQNTPTNTNNLYCITDSISNHKCARVGYY